MAVSIYIPTNIVRVSIFSTLSPAFILCRFFDDGYSNQWKVIPNCISDFHFSDNLWCWESFHVFFWPSVCLLCRNVYLCLPIFYWFFLFLLLKWTVCIFWRLTLVGRFICQYFLQFYGLSFCFVSGFHYCTKSLWVSRKWIKKDLPLFIAETGLFMLPPKNFSV